MDKEKKNLLVFGYGLGLIALVFGTGGLLKHGAQLAPLVLLACSAVFIAVTALDHTALKPGYKGWMAVAHIIGMVVTTAILSAVFFCIFTPVGIVLRLAGKDHMDRSLRPGAPTYWLPRRRTFQKEQYKQQF